LSSGVFPDLAGHVVGLARVPRISALAMFLSAHDKKILDHLVENVLGQNCLAEVEKKEIKKAFC
jgi:hypothetical protein